MSRSTFERALGAYLALNAVGFLALGLWCAARVDAVSASIGYAFGHTGARVEFIAMYGGLEVALGLFYAGSLWDPRLRPAALILSACLYVGLAAFRIGAAGLLGSAEGLTVPLAATEVLLAAAALILLARAGDAGA